MGSARVRAPTAGTRPSVKGPKARRPQDGKCAGPDGHRGHSAQRERAEGEATTRWEVRGSGAPTAGTRPSVKGPKARRPQARKRSPPRNVGDGAGAPVIMIGDSRAAYVDVEASLR